MTLYLDSSSLVKLYVAEPDTDAVRRLVGGAAVVTTSQIAYPETRAALARRRRERALSADEFATAKRTFDADWTRYFAVEVTALLCREAGELAERLRLRGFDSVHLASFAEVVRTVGVRDAHFSTFDERLARAGRTLLRELS